MASQSSYANSASSLVQECLCCHADHLPGDHWPPTGHAAFLQHEVISNNLPLVSWESTHIQDVLSRVVAKSDSHLSSSNVCVWPLNSGEVIAVQGSRVSSGGWGCLSSFVQKTLSPSGLMELKVWVDGAVRVVCGLSEETSCQDVVIALAQAIERPLESLAKLGQHSSEVQFFLRRTGPSSNDGPSSKHDKTPPNSLPKHAEPEPLKRNQPKKALTFNLGPSTSPKTPAKPIKRSPRDSPEQRASPSPRPESPRGTKPGPSPPVGSSKDEVFKKVLQQQERLRAIEAQLESLERDSANLEALLSISVSLPGL
ncbi:Ras association domain-containing protein 7 [Oryzias melastigma]|uniref:Ras association domain-containing protein 7 n=1 Tax=Oryzias melastigma TaxID=30732 RepID=A0A834CJH1_ORYME|nr:Ras association domain-containing protein 7 [Oryzias melastigma]